MSAIYSRLPAEIQEAIDTLRSGHASELRHRAVARAREAELIRQAEAEAADRRARGDRWQGEVVLMSDGLHFIERGQP